MDTELLQLLNRLSPSNQRLARELIWKLAQLEQLTIPDDHDANLDHAAHIDAWLQSLLSARRSPSTIRHYHSTITHLLATNPHPKRAHVEAFIATTTAQGRHPSTIINHIAALKSFFGYLADRDIIATNPAAKLASPRRPLRGRNPATDQDVATLLTAPKSHRHQTLLLLLIDCGLRASELASLQIDNIDLDTGLIAVIGKGDKQRYVPLSPVTAAAITKQINELASLAYTGPWLFPGTDPTNNLSLRGVDDYLRRLSNKLGITVTPHQLRHYFATKMLSSGASLKAVSTMLGHAQTSTTANIYWHIIDIQEVIDQHTKFSPLKGVTNASHQNQD